MAKKPSRLGLLWGLLASVGAHGVAVAGFSYLFPPEPKPPKPFALRALKSLAGGEAMHLQESARLVCASFPFICEEERFVQLEITEIKDPIKEKDPIDEKIEPEKEPPKPEKIEPEKPKEVPKIEPPKPEEKKKEEEKKPEDAMTFVPPPPVDQPKERPKSVDQVVEKEDKFNPNAQFLAEQTHIVEEQTQARVTSHSNMDKRAEAVSDPDGEESPEAGSEEQKIASVQEKRAAATDPKKNQVFKENQVKPPDQVVASPGEQKEGKKGTEGEKNPQTPSVIDPTGLGEAVAIAPVKPGNEGTNGQGEKGENKGSKNDPKTKKGQPRLKLTMSDFQQLYGETEGAAVGQEEQNATAKGGKTSKRAKFVMAQLENYLPEVKPGNQTALSTAADPFAKFIHQAHLRIHQEWGDGVLRDFDKMGGSSAYNNPALLVTLEIVVNSDGTLDKVTRVGSSGSTPFDVAAIAAIYDAAPFPVPPENIRSYNGKVYMRWTLHRDSRQCATSFAEPFILANPGGEEPALPAPTSAPAKAGFKPSDLDN